MESSNARGPRGGGGLVWSLVLLGGVLGALAGLGEAWFVSVTRATTMTPRGAADVALLYAILWAAVGAALGLVGLLTRALRGSTPDPARRRAFYGSLLLALVLVLEIGGYVNLVHLPSMFSRTSLVLNVLLLAGAGLVWFGVFAACLRRVEPSRRGRAHRRALPIAAAVVAAVLVVLAILPGEDDGATPAAGIPADGPNVLFLLVDATRADHLGCYGYERDTSPTLDRLAAQGVLCANAYANGSRTKETTATIVTSLYPSTHGVSRLSDALPTESPSLIERMRDTGYRTAVFSANPVVSPVFGFGRGVGHFYCDAPPIVRRAVLPQLAASVNWTVGRRIAPFSWPFRTLRRLERLLPQARTRPEFTGGDAREINGRFVEWLDREVEAPFFAYLHYMEPHAPYDPPSPFDTRFDSDFEGPRVTNVPPDPWILLPFVRGTEVPERERRNMVAQYDGSIASFDHELGGLLAEIEDRGLARETLVVVTSDHGEEFYEHGGWGHGHSMYEELIHVPLILRWTGRLPAGHVDRTAFRQIDLAPTILGAVGLVEGHEAPGMEGLNLWPILSSATELGRDLPVMSELYGGGHALQAMRKGRHKVIRARMEERESVQLFDLAEDPAELHDLSEERPDLAAALLSELESLHAEAAADRRDVESGAMDEGLRERLRALGYIE
mgnify:CR=1 FL=1